jgi:hypothetical protein
VLTQLPDRRLLAIELQHSPIDLDELEERAGDYARRDIAQVWVPFLKQVDDYERYPASPLVRWVSGYNFGEDVWFYDQKRKLFVRGVLGDCWLEVEATEWGGGYSYRSRRWRSLKLSSFRPFDRVSVAAKFRQKSALSVYR